MRSLPENYQQLDGKVAFQNTEVRKEDYISRRLPYKLEAGTTEAFHELFDTLYSADNLMKLMYAVGSVHKR